MTEFNETKLYDEVQELLMNVEDPEVGINIIDLGLVYGIDIAPHGIFLTITLTSAACPLQDYIEEDIRNVLGTSELVTQPVFFNWVFSPSWSVSMMTDDGIEMFRAIGGSVPVY